MDNLCKKLMLGSSTAALVTAMSMAGAQAQDIESVEVSASLISIAGYTSPTPVTSVSPESLAAAAKPDIGDAIRELPTITGGSPQAGTGSEGISGAAEGVSTVSIANHGDATLVLFDGQRVVSSNLSTVIDVNTIPSTLVERVDVVTGGASSTWGSDAVAGVINLILNKTFTGFKANLSASTNENDTYRTYKAEASWGTDFDGGRGHIILSGAYTASPDTVTSEQLPWTSDRRVEANPAFTAAKCKITPTAVGSNSDIYSETTTCPGVPQYITVYNSGQSQATPGGFISASPKGTVAAANALANINFVGPGATPEAFCMGNISGSIAWGGQSGYYNSESALQQVADPLHSMTAFVYGSYKITDNVQASIQLNYGRSLSVDTGQFAFQLANITITSDNPYIPASIQALMTAGGITSFTLGTLNTNNDTTHDTSARDHALTVGIPVNYNYRQLMRGVFTLTGTIGDNWSWQSYFEHGIVRTWLRVTDNTSKSDLANAEDAVTVTAANVGTSKLPIGSIACRTTLTDPGNGCAPLDVFGTGVASPEAIAYVDSYSNGSTNSQNIDYENITINQDVFDADMQGTVPSPLPAGDIAVAFGALYRKEGARTVSDPRNNAGFSWYSGNFLNFAGQYNVEEGFLEINAPILKDQFVESLNINAAGRLTSYSTSGLVEPWKIGFISQVNDDVRVRATYSVDIRAPQLNELFSGGQVNIGSQIDPHTNLNVFNANDAIGNSLLKPEISDQLTGGVVLTPTFIDGFSTSIDWYQVTTHGQITAVNAYTQCTAGHVQFCNQLIFNGPGGALGSTIAQPVNAAYTTVSGIDWNIDYTMPLFSGSLSWHFVSQYVDESTVNTLGIICDGMGSAGVNTTCGGGPKFQGLLAATYNEGPFSGTVQTRFTSDELQNLSWQEGINIDKQYVPWKFYLDLRASYKWNDNIQFYTAIDDATNAPPIIIPAFGGSYQTSFGTGDTLGRIVRVGIRLND